MDRRCLWGVLAGLLAVEAIQAGEALRSFQTPPARQEKEEAHKPSYRIQPTDWLQICVRQGKPRGRYPIRPLDRLRIGGQRTPREPIKEEATVDLAGEIHLSHSRAALFVVGNTPEEAAVAIQEHLEQGGYKPRVTVSLISCWNLQQVAGEKLVGPDGTIHLGNSDYIKVKGLTVADARARIEHHLAKWVQAPVISVDVLGYDRKVYQVVVIDGRGHEQQVTRLPITANDTVIDAIGAASAQKHISVDTKMWLARPAPNADGGDEILSIDWQGITTAGETATNFQLLPGDRIYIQTGKAR